LNHGEHGDHREVTEAKPTLGTERAAADVSANGHAAGANGHKSQQVSALAGE
jgi:hypothetical protein